MIQSLVNALGAPLVNDEILGITVPVKKLLSAANRGHYPAELGASQPLTALARDDDCPPLFEHVPGRGHPLADLIKGCIQGISATGGDDHIYPLPHLNRAMMVNHFATGQVRLVVMPCK